MGSITKEQYALHCFALGGGVEDDADDVDVVGADDDDHRGVVRDNCLLHKCSCPSSNQPVNVDFDKKVGF